tara:strand:+ start:1639 stop:2361 length:723 start_codon:yes stop_codon:yes gene_type:complete
MKILFVQPMAVADEIIPPLHFGYLAGSISKGHEVRILDQLKDRYNLKHLLSIILRENPDVIGLSAYTKDLSFIYKFSIKLNHIVPDSKIVLGGVQMTLMPEETFRYLWNYVDFGFVGECEADFSKFVDAFEIGIENENFKDFSNLVWKNNGEVIVNKKNIPNQLDALPFPRWELVDPRGYPKAPHGAFLKQFPAAPIITSRGCPYPCTFCAASSISEKKSDTDQWTMSLKKFNCSIKNLM